MRAPEQAPDDPPPSDEPVARPTPMMEQYLEIKVAHPGSLLFYRMGDFYELFFEDAEEASRTLGIVLTKRGKHLGQDIPMCGVPVERATDYLHKLIAAGYRVAICEQMEDPAEAKKRGSKSVVKRDVVRLVTAGTLTEDNLLDARTNNYLVALARVRVSDTTDLYGVARADISTGDFVVETVEPGVLSAVLARIGPSEIILPDALFEDPALRELWRGIKAVQPLGRDVFDGATADRRLADHFGVATTEAFGTFPRVEAIAAAALVAYVTRTQVGTRTALRPPTRVAVAGTMLIDASTRANLELTRTLAGERKGSLLDTMDRTVTPAGSRLLAARLAAPLTDVTAIRSRHDAVGALIADRALLSTLRAELEQAPDMARALARLVPGRGGPRDLLAIGQGIAAGLAIAGHLGSVADQSPDLACARAVLEALSGDLSAKLLQALAYDVPLSKRDGGFVRAGFEPALDEARALRDESRLVIAALQGRYAEETGIRTLKVRHNNVLGYFVEVTQANADRLTQPPMNAVFIHRQTLAGQMRFSTAELGDLESRIASAADRALKLELEWFEALAREVIAAADQLLAGAQALAAIDVTAALARLALDAGHVRPVVDDSVAFRIDGGRHPVVEAALKGSGTPFVGNACDLTDGDQARLLIVTGPNMAGKSTFLRQNALMAVLAQMGAYVPATAAHIGIVDRLFSRVGAADDLARGRSTFMVEMVETAAILHQAGPRALVILDEIGRGTATFDGLSIAWAAIEHLHAVNQCRALFATHYHELTALAARLSRVANVTMRVKEWQGDVVFLHEVIAGAADRSYGIQVARLAGLPVAVIERAKAVLEALESADRGKKPAALIDDLPLFSAVPAAPKARLADPKAAALAEAVRALDPDQMTPREAMDRLYALKAMLS
jgi:DNA mismatch repair protein MutS